jgi:asparagine synthase (glutamine-hydrolysing)
VRKIASYVRQASEPMPGRMSAHSIMSLLGVDQVLQPDFLRTLDLESPAWLEREVYQRADAQSLVNRMLAFDWKFTLADNDLPKVLGAAGLARVSVGFPFLSDEVVDLSLRVPADWKVRGFTLRWFFKQSLRDFLPAEVLHKKKHGFGLPFGPWLVRHERLRQLAGDSFAGLRRRGWIRPQFLDLLLERKVAEHPGYYGEMVWILVMLEQWFETRRGAGQALPWAA